MREAAGPAIWSRGVELVRAGAVIGEAEREGEILLRVALRGGVLSHAVSLQPGDVTWECDCRGAYDPCEHVAAAVIALRRARQEGRALPAPAAGGPAFSPRTPRSNTACSRRPPLGQERRSW